MVSWISEWRQSGTSWRVRSMLRLSIGCLFGFHRPMLTSIIRRQDCFTALCDGCGLPLARPNKGRWTVPGPLASQRDQTA